MAQGPKAHTKKKQRTESFDIVHTYLRDVGDAPTPPNPTPLFHSDQSNPVIPTNPTPHYPSRPTPPPLSQPIQTNPPSSIPPYLRDVGDALGEDVDGHVVAVLEAELVRLLPQPRDLGMLCVWGGGDGG